MRTVTNGTFPPPATVYPRTATVYPLTAEDEIEESKQLDKLLALDRIEKSSSQTPAGTFFEDKQCIDCHQLKCSCGSKNYERQWVIDYRPLNAVTLQDTYPLPSIKDLMSLTTGHKLYTKFNIHSAFHLIPIHLDDRHKTAFHCSRGISQWKVMPFGLKGAPAMFQRMIDMILNPVREFCRAFMDDGIVWADDEEEMVARNRKTLETEKHSNVYARLTFGNACLTSLRTTC